MATSGIILVVASAADAQGSAQTGVLVVNSPIFVVPDANRTPLIVLEAGTTVTILGKIDDWYRIEFDDQQLGPRVGYVRVDNVRVGARNGRPVPEPGGPAQPGTGSATRSARSTAGPPAKNRAIGPYLDVNAVYQSSSRFTDAYVYPLNIETAIVAVAYHIASIPAIDISAGRGVWRKVGMAVGVSGFAKTGNATVTGSIPHPFYFNQPRTLNGSVADLPRREIALHINGFVAAPPMRRVEVMVFGGPTLFVVTQKVAATLRYLDNYPHDSVALDQPNIEQQSKARFGFNVGADVTVMLSKKVGIGGIARFSRASIPFTTTDSQFTARAGGTQVGAGVRFRL